MSDLVLAAIQGGDRAAFARWMVSAEPAVRRHVRSFATVVDVEVVVQEALLRAWTFAWRVEPHPAGDALLRYTLRTARNLAIDMARREGREAPEEAPPAVGPPAADPLLARAIQRCLDALPAQPKLAIELRLHHGATDDPSLAEVAGMKTNTFLQNVGRARRLLVDCLSAAGVALEVA